MADSLGAIKDGGGTDEAIFLLLSFPDKYVSIPELQSGSREW
jgi:hypothetical protein